MRWNFGNKPVTVCIPAREFTFFGEVSDGKFLRHAFLNAAAPEEIFAAARAAGFSADNLTVMVTWPEFRLTFAPFPDMPEEDLQSSLSWEADVLFRMERPRMASTVVSHSPEGYRVLATAVPEAVCARWEEAAQSAGMRISHIRPAFCAAREEAGVFCLCSKKAARVLIRKGDVWDEVRRLDLDDEETLRDLRETVSEISWFPTADCDAEMRAAWHAFLRPSETDVSRETWEKELFFSAAAALASGGKEPDLARGGAAKDFLSKIGKDGMPYVCAAGLAALLLCGFGAEYAAARMELGRALTQREALAPQREVMRKARAKETERVAEARECAEFFKEGGQWQRKLLTLADTVPAGVTISAIEGGDTVKIRGTASKAGDVSELARLLSLSWEMNVRRESVKRADAAPLLQFELRAEKEAAHGK